MRGAHGFGIITCNETPPHARQSGPEDNSRVKNRIGGKGGLALPVKEGYIFNSGVVVYNKVPHGGQG